DAQISEIDGGLLVNWDIRDGEFAHGVPEAMFAAFEQLVQAVARDDRWESPVGSLLPAYQRRARLAANQTAGPRSEVTLHQGFFDNVGARADDPAVLWVGQGMLTYAQLAQRALRVAAGLREQGVRPGDSVALTLPQGPEQVVAVLAVLAAGGMYVPVGIEQPAARAERIARMAGYRILVTTGDGGHVPPGVTRLALSDLMDTDPLPAPVPVHHEQPAYLLFTSGSTGEPKCVEVPHRAAMNTIDDLL